MRGRYQTVEIRTMKQLDFNISTFNFIKLRPKKSEKKKRNLNLNQKRN